jgi:hypothetical protein
MKLRKSTRARIDGGSEGFGSRSSVYQCWASLGEHHKVIGINQLTLPKISKFNVFLNILSSVCSDM